MKVSALAPGEWWQFENPDGVFQAWLKEYFSFVNLFSVTEDRCCEMLLHLITYCTVNVSSVQRHFISVDWKLIY